MSTEAPISSSPSTGDGLAVGVGGALGAAGRWVVTGMIDGWAGLVVVNVAGTALAAAVLAGLVALPGPGRRRRAFLVTGVAGGLTTASTVLVDLADDPDAGAIGAVIVMLVLTVGLASVVGRRTGQAST